MLIPIENNGSLQGCILVHKIHAPNCVKKTPYDSSLGSNWHFRAAYHTYDQELCLMPLCQANTTLPSGFPFRPSVWYFRWKKYRHMQCPFFCVRMTDTTPDPIIVNGVCWVPSVSVSLFREWNRETEPHNGSVDLS